MTVRDYYGRTFTGSLSKTGAQGLFTVSGSFRNTIRSNIFVPVRDRYVTWTLQLVMGYFAADLTTIKVIFGNGSSPDLRTSVSDIPLVMFYPTGSAGVNMTSALLRNVTHTFSGNNMTLNLSQIFPNNGAYFFGGTISITFGVVLNDTKGDTPWTSMDRVILSAEVFSRASNPISLDVAGSLTRTTSNSLIPSYLSYPVVHTVIDVDGFSMPLSSYLADASASPNSTLLYQFYMLMDGMETLPWAPTQCSTLFRL
jgi:hypothetical protein